MPKKSLPKAMDTKAVATLADILRPSDTLPTEDPSVAEAIRAWYVAELKPASPYQAVLVSHLVDAERDIQQIRALRTGFLRNAMAKEAEEVFTGSYVREQEGWGERTIALMDPYSKDHQEAVETLQEFGITLNDLAARAYSDCFRNIQALDKELDRAHRRRQALRAQYDALARAEAQVEDAEILEA